MKDVYKGHLAMLTASVLWGLMAPISKVVLNAGVLSSFALTDFRIFGAAVVFWIASAFAPKEKVTPGDMLQLFFAALLAIVFNQGSYIVGVGLTSPIDASVITTSTPILTMIISALYLKEPITGKKVIGVMLGAAGALLLIMSGQQQGGAAGNVWGDLLCLSAQLCFSMYIVFYKGLISRYSPITIMKWMFTYASICMVPFSYSIMSGVQWSNIGWDVIGGVAYIVLCGTFITYLILPVGQRNLRPTVAVMYNYVQPIVASTATLLWGIGEFTFLKVIAIMLVFVGVFVVTQSKSRQQIEAEKCHSDS